LKRNACSICKGTKGLLNTFVRVAGFATHQGKKPGVLEQKNTQAVEAKDNGEKSACAVTLRGGESNQKGKKDRRPKKERECANETGGLPHF